MRGNSHVQFLGGDGAVMHCLYPTNKVSDEHHVAEPAAKATARNGNNGAGKSAKQAGPEPF